MRLGLQISGWMGGLSCDAQAVEERSRARIVGMVITSRVRLPGDNRSPVE